MRDNHISGAMFMVAGALFAIGAYWLLTPTS